MIKCVCGADPEVCYCAFQVFHQPPPESEADRIDMEDEDYPDGFEDWAETDFEVPTND